MLVGRTQAGPIPPCTRRVRVILAGRRYAGSDSIDAYFDNVSLTFAAGAARGPACGASTPASPPPSAQSAPPLASSPQPRSVTQPPGSCGNAPGQRVCVSAPEDITRFGCLRRGSFVHRFGVKLKKRRAGLIVNRRSRVRIVRFALDARASGSDSRRPYYALVDGTVLTAGAHALSAEVLLKVPRRERYFRKRLRFGFGTCA